MARILITSGPTRQYLDPVRYLSNASSGQMGSCLAAAAIAMGHEVVIVSGPVAIDYPPAATVIEVVTTDEMLATATAQFPTCDGLIAAAAPCDYRPIVVSDQKMSKTGEGLQLNLVETPDIVATLGATKEAHQWSVGFALETTDPHLNAVAKLQRKFCELIVLNGVTAINSPTNEIEILDADGQVIESASGSKSTVAVAILDTIQKQLVDR